MEYEVMAKQGLGSKLLNFGKSIFPIAGNIVQGILNWKAQKKSNLQNLQTGITLADKQYNRDMELMKYQQQYNSPESQMQRFKEAGLNPNLIYSKGDSGNLAQVVPKYNAPSYDMSLPAKVKGLNQLGSYYDTTMQRLDVDKQRTMNGILSAEKMKKVNEAIISSMYAFDMAKNKMTESDYRAFKANIDKIILNEFKNEYGASKAYEWNKTEYELGKTQADARKAKAEAGISEKNLQFLNMGLPWMMPLNLMLSNVLRFIK